MKVKHIISTCGIIFGGIVATTGASAVVTYRDSSSIQFTFAPVLSMSLSSDNFIIEGLAPGTSSVSNAVTTTVSTNSVYGYQLLATVGDSTYTTSDLVNTSGTTGFTMMGSGTSLTSGTWGYTLDSGTTYGALSTTTPAVIKSTSTPTEGTGDATPIRIGAYAASDQRPDTYSNVVNLMAVANVPSEPTPYEKLVAGTLSMQELGNLSSEEKTTLISQMQSNTTYNVSDNRDGQSYTIAKLADGNVWMGDNLNLGATTLSQDLTSSNTNIATTVSASTFNSWKKPSGTDDYTTAVLIPVSGTDSTSGTAYGTLYNYCATSAGTICTDDNSSDATYDICPKGWRLPTGGSSGEFQALYNNEAYNSYAKMRAPISSGGAAFALAGGFFESGPMDYEITGLYWSSTRSDSRSMYSLGLLDLDPSVYPAYYDVRRNGDSIRCILK